MKAKRFEFRFRRAIITGLYVIGFWTPWLRLSQASEIGSMRLWSWLAIEAARLEIIPVEAGYLAVTILAAMFAVLGAAFRLWGTAYLGHRTVFNSDMQAAEVVAAGPYRHVRNPLYIGSLLMAFAVSILMPASGALFFVIALSIFVARLVLGEEAFLRAKIGNAYIEYSRRVSRWLPSLAPRLPASSVRPAWAAAVIGEVFPLGMAICFLIFAWNYNAQLLIRCMLVCFGASLITRAVQRSRPA